MKYKLFLVITFCTILAGCNNNSEKAVVTEKTDNHFTMESKSFRYTFEYHEGDKHDTIDNVATVTYTRPIIYVQCDTYDKYELLKSSLKQDKALDIPGEITMRFSLSDVFDLFGHCNSLTFSPLSDGEMEVMIDTSDSFKSHFGIDKSKWGSSEPFSVDITGLSDMQNLVYFGVSDSDATQLIKDLKAEYKTCVGSDTKEQYILEIVDAMAIRGCDISESSQAVISQYKR
jgi:hypothetical protein